MPIIACPNCQGKLRFPDDTPSRRVKCPTCGHIFMSGPVADPDPPAPPGRTARSPRSDFDDRRYRDDDDRGRRRRPDEDDDDRPARRRDDDRDRRRDDDEDDRRSRRRHKELDDYDDRPRRRPDRRAIEGQFNRASLACLLLFIAGWLLVGGLAVLVFASLLRWAEIWEGLNAFLVIAGLLGLGHLLTAAVGYGFLVSGPRERGGLGLSIATAAVGAFHLILTVILATTDVRSAWGGQYMSVRWPSFVSQSNDLGYLLYLMIGPFHGPFPRLSVSGGRVIMAVFVNLAEVALVVLFLLTLRAYALAAHDKRRAKTVMQAVIANGIAAGAMVLAGVLFGVLFRAVETEKGGMTAVDNVYHIVVYLVQIGVAVWTTLVIKGVKETLDYRPD